MKILITGGSGFIGSNLAEALLSKGHEVCILDNISTGRLENISKIKEKIELINGDIRNLETVNNATKDVNYILHQAALPSVSRSVENPLESNEHNVIGTLNIMESARKNDVEMVVFASSSSVYGDTPELPKREDMKLTPLSPYAVTKLAGEQYFSAFNNVYGLRSIGLRYFNVYGPNQSPDSDYAAVIPKFIKCSLTGESPIIYGDGKQTRDFTFIKDVVNANILSMENKTIKHDVFNVGSGKSISVNELLKTISGILNKEVSAKHVDPREGDIRDSLADISKAREKIGYDPEYDVAKGLKETIAWFKGSYHV